MNCNQILDCHRTRFIEIAVSTPQAPAIHSFHVIRGRESYKVAKIRTSNFHERIELPKTPPCLLLD